MVLAGKILELLKLINNMRKIKYVTSSKIVICNDNKKRRSKIYTEAVKAEAYI